MTPDKPILIRLSGNPQGKERPRFVRASGRAFTPAATRSYEAALRYRAQEVMGETPPLTGPLEVLVVAGFPIPQSMSKGKRAQALIGELRPVVKPDIDNLLKCFDALNGVVWVDDKQIVVATVKKLYALDPALSIQVKAAA